MHNLIALVLIVLLPTLSWGHTRYSRGDLEITISGEERDLVEVRLGDAIHREKFVDWPKLPRYATVVLAPTGVGAFAIVDARARPDGESGERFVLGAWDQGSPTQPRRLHTVSATSDPEHLPFQQKKASVSVRWLSATTARISQQIPTTEKAYGPTRELVRVVRFSDKNRRWEQVWPNEASAKPEDAPIVIKARSRGAE